jgi:hypothetical protein
MTFVRRAATQSAGNISMLKACQNLALCHSQLFFGIFDDGGGSNDSGGFLLFREEEFLAGHEELGLASFSQREQITVLRSDATGAGGQVPAKKEKSRRPAASNSAALARSLGHRAGDRDRSSNVGERPVSRLLYWK